MQQYYDKGDIQLYLGDCIEILEKAAPESVDMILLIRLICCLMAEYLAKQGKSFALIKVNGMKARV